MEFMCLLVFFRVKKDVFLFIMTTQVIIFHFFCFFLNVTDIELREIQTSDTIGRLNMSNDTIRRTNTIFPFFKSIEPENNVKSFGQKAHVQPCSNRF